MKTTPRAGDYVRTAGMTEEQYHAVAKVFLAAGFSDNEYPNLAHFKAQKYFGIHTKGSGLFHGSRCRLGSILDGRELSLSDLLGDELPGEPIGKYSGMGDEARKAGKINTSDPKWSGDGLPPVGAECEYNTGSLRYGWQKVYICGLTNDGKPVHQYENGCVDVISNEYIGIMQSYYRPLKSERELAIEELEYYTDQPDITPHGIAVSIYDAGYRRVEK